MKKTIIYISLFLLIFSVTPTRGQDYLFSLGWWKFQRMNGFLEFEGFFRQRETFLKKGQHEIIQTRNLLGQFSLNTRSFVLHPNLFLLDVNGAYQPITRREAFLVYPDRTETHSIEKFGIETTFLRKAPIWFFSGYRYMHDFTNREYITDVESFKNLYFFSLHLQKFLPTILKFKNEDWRQQEIQTGRRFLTQRKILSLDSRISLTGKDLNSLVATRELFNRDYTGFAYMSTTIDNINLSNRFPFTIWQPSLFSSNIWFYRQRGFNMLDRFNVLENMELGLRKNLFMTGRYQYTFTRQTAFYEYNQHHLNWQLRHKLYASLRTRLSLNYFASNFPTYRDRIPFGGIHFNYRKRIPTGYLSMEYEYTLRRDKRTGFPSTIRIIDEQITLRDDQTTVLENPFVVPGSVVVTDETGTIVYQENFDYVLIPRGDYLEIQRIPGGQIPNGATVLVDYKSDLPVAYQFDTKSQRFSAQVSLFQDHLSLSYSILNKDNFNINLETPRILQYIHQQVYRGEVRVAFLNAGAQYTDFRSNILPYTEERYYGSIAGNFWNIFDFFVSGNYRYYDFTLDRERRLIKDITGKLTYWLGLESKLVIDGSARIQRGRSLDMDLLIGRAEIQLKYRALSYILGAEYYKRDYIGELSNFSGIYVKIRRDF